MNAVVLEIVRQFLRWLGLALINLPWVPDAFVALTGNEEVILWLTGLVSYALADTGWLVAKWRQFRAWRGKPE